MERRIQCNGPRHSSVVSPCHEQICLDGTVCRPTVPLPNHRGCRSPNTEDCPSIPPLYCNCQPTSTEFDCTGLMCGGRGVTRVDPSLHFLWIFEPHTVFLWIFEPQSTLSSHLTETHPTLDSSSLPGMNDMAVLSFTSIFLIQITS